MIAIDLDGTLLSPSGTVTARVKSAVHAALDAGLLICFATGRNFTESKSVLDDVAHYDSAVFVGGAMVIDTQQQVTLHRMLMEPQLTREVCAEIESAGHAALALQDTADAGVDYFITEGTPVNENTTQWLVLTRATWKHVKDLSQHTHEHTVRVGLVASPEQTAEMESRLTKKFGERIYSHSVIVPAHNVAVLEVFDPSVNKWEGILHVARHHNIAAKDIIAIGDDVNDIHMIKNAGLGVAMGNANPAIKKLAKLVIGPNHDEGLAVYLEELVRTRAVRPIEADSTEAA